MQSYEPATDFTADNTEQISFDLNDNDDVIIDNMSDDEGDINFKLDEEDY
jgi:hypothetical protein